MVGAGYSGTRGDLQQTIGVGRPGAGERTPPARKGERPDGEGCGTNLQASKLLLTEREVREMETLWPLTPKDTYALNQYGPSTASTRER